MRCETKTATQRPVAGGPYRVYPGTCEYCVVDSNNFIKGTQGQWNVEPGPINQNRFTNNLTSGSPYSLKVSLGDSLIFCNNATITPQLFDQSTAICRPYDTTSVNEFLEGADRIGIYPNPSHGKFSVSGTGQPDEILLLDAQGRKVFETGKLILPATVDPENLPRGLYFLRCSKSGKGITRKVRIE
jgi:hypothetical protein